MEEQLVKHRNETGEIYIQFYIASIFLFTPLPLTRFQLGYIYYGYHSYFSNITDNNSGLVKTLEKDKQFLMSEIGKMKARYAELHGQIDQMTKLMDEKQVHVHLSRNVPLVLFLRKRMEK